MNKAGSRIEDRDRNAARAFPRNIGDESALFLNEGASLHGAAPLLRGGSRIEVIPISNQFQRGFSLISAIFLLVVIALLSTFAVTLSSTQSQSQAMDMMEARGYQAALAGIEWAAYNVNGQPVNSPAAWDGCVTGAAVAVGGNLAPFSPVTVNCTAASYVEGTTMRWVYRVEAIARTAGSAGDENYVEQTAAAKLVK